jgi:hypothetical protein
MSGTVWQKNWTNIILISVFLCLVFEITLKRQLTATLICNSRKIHNLVSSPCQLIPFLQYYSTTLIFTSHLWFKIQNYKTSYIPDTNSVTVKDETQKDKDKVNPQGRIVIHFC